MQKQEWKQLLQKSGEKLKKISRQAGVLAKEVKEEAVLGTELSKLKAAKMNLGLKRNKLIRSLGEESLKLIREDKINDKKLDSLSAQIENVENQIKKAEKDAKECQGKITERWKSLPKKLKVE